jgi:glycosyltransferase involved in cell wall biosynthesis
MACSESQAAQPPPLVSVITPVFNCCRFIEQTIDSVRAQTHADWEMICVDDCSSDGSGELVQSLIDKDCRIRLIRLEENSGAAVARNVAIEAARGRYIAFLDSDDIWLPYKLEHQLEYMQSNNAPFCFSAYARIDEHNNVICTVGVPPQVSYQGMLKTSVIGCLTAIYDTEFFGKVSMPLARKRQDFALWLQLLKRIDVARGIPEVLALYRVRQDSMSANKFDAARHTWNIYRKVEGFGFWRSFYYFSHYGFRGLLRSKFPGLARRLHVLD